LRFDVLTAVKMSIMVQRTAFILRPEGEGSKHFPLKLLFPLTSPRCITTQKTTIVLDFMGLVVSSD
jgi:hypothetical protein